MERSCQVTHSKRLRANHEFASLDGDITCFCEKFNPDGNTSAEVNGVARCQQTSLCSNNIIMADVTSISEILNDIEDNLRTATITAEATSIPEIYEIENDLPRVKKEKNQIISRRKSSKQFIVIQLI